VKLFVFTRSAGADLFELWSYIAKDNLDAADQVESDILASCRKLVSHPELGHKRPDLRLGSALSARFNSLLKSLDQIARNVMKNPTSDWLVLKCPVTKSNSSSPSESARSRTFPVTPLCMLPSCISTKLSKGRYL
jgi:plasmid stabilization system protein ParE